MTLRHRLTLLVAIALIPPLLLTLYNVVRSQVVVHREARDESLVAARLIAAEFAQVLEASRQLMISLALHPAVPDDEAACAAYFRSVIAEIPIYREAAVIDTSGASHCATTPRPVNPGVTSSVTFREPMSTGALTVGPLRRDPETRAPLLQVSMPWRDTAGATRGVIVLVIDPKEIAQDLASREWRAHHRVFVLDRDGAVVVAVPREGAEDIKAIARDVFPRLASGTAGPTATAGPSTTSDTALTSPPAVTGTVPASGTMTGSEAVPAKGPTGRSEIVGFVPVENTPRGLFVGVAIDQEMALADARRVNKQNLAFALVTMLLAVGGTAVATHILIDRPIRAIVNTARRREAGDMTAAFPAFPSSAEFGQLSTALSSMSAKIHDLLEQKGFLLRELQHRVMNSLTLLSSVLESQRRNVKNPVAREHLQRARDRVGAMATVYRYLYQTDTPDDVEFSGFLKVICSESQNAYAGTHKPTITVEADRLELPGSPAISLAMLTHELITNALKHAYPEGQPGRIDVTLRRNGDDIELRVADEGRGMPEGFQIDQSRSLGMRFVSSTVRQFCGTLTINRREPGTEFIIRLLAATLEARRA